MTRGGLPALAELEIADAPALWSQIGCSVGTDGVLLVGGVTIRLTGADTAGEGIRSWTLRAERALPESIDGIATHTLAPGDVPVSRAPAHANGVTGVDHVVVTTPDIERTLDALRGTGLEVRRIRDAGSAEQPMRQAFLWAGEVLVEVAGPPAATGDGPARLWGLVLVTGSVDQLASQAPSLVGTPRDAVQPGRRIVSLRRDAGSSVRLAFMTPHLRAARARRIRGLMRFRGPIAAVLAACAAVLPGSAAASGPVTTMAPAPPSARAAQAPPVELATPAPGSKTMLLKYGPMNIRPGQNLISVDLMKERPNVDGWITGFRPGMIRVSDGKSPPVGNVHLHHAVWLVDWYPTFASGEEKTYINAPRGFGWRYTTRQSWILNHMIHNLTPTPEKVYLTMEIDLIPDTAPEAAGITEVKTRWMDVQGLTPYPVFNVARSSGKAGKVTYPDDFPNAYKKAPRIRNRWVADRDATLVGTIGHVHPGGLGTDLWLKRGDQKVNLFRSNAHYFDPRGPISWDMGDDRLAVGVAHRHQEGRRALDHSRLRDQARRLVRVDGDHARRDHERARRRRRPVQRADRQARGPQPRAPAREHRPRPQDRTRGSRTRCACATARYVDRITIKNFSLRPG